MRILCVKLNDKIARLVESEARRRNMNISTYIKYALYYFTLASIAEHYSLASVVFTSSGYINNPDSYKNQNSNEQKLI